MDLSEIGCDDVGFREDSNELKGSTKVWEFLDQLSDCYLLEEDSAPWI
jgi:hypothetical protein